MKNKRLISTLCITLATAFGAFAVGYNQKQVKPVRADTDDSLLFFVAFDASTIPASYRDKCSNFRAHFWFKDSSPDAYFTLHETGYDYLYAANTCFKTAKNVAGYQFIFYQADSGDDTGDKYSIDLTGKDACDDLYNAVWYGGYNTFFYTFVDSWSGGKWNVSINNSSAPISLKVNGSSIANASYAVDSGSISIKNFTISSASQDVELDLGFSSTYHSQNNYAYSCIYDTNLVEQGVGNNTIRFKEAGNYSIFVQNSLKRGYIDCVYEEGFILIKKDSGSIQNIDYVFYVSEDAREDGNANIYTYGSANGTGNWPGRNFGVLGYELVDFNGNFKFQNKSTYCRVYKVLYDKCGINFMDDGVIFNFTGEASGQTANLQLVERSAYWRNSAAGTSNYDAGAALDLFLELQTILDGVDPYDYKGHLLENSICAIPNSDAARLYEAYMGLPQSVRVTYVDSSYINTYNSDGTGTDYISAYNIFQELGKRSGATPNGARALFFSTLGDLGNNNIFAIVLVTVVSIASVGAFFAFKKKKQD